MTSKLTIAAVAIAMMAPIAPMAAPAQAASYHGHNRTYHRRCHRSKGTTGLLVGAGGGGLGAAALGAGPIGIAAGVIGGGLLGRHVDKRSNAAHNRRKGC